MHNMELHYVKGQIAIFFVSVSVKAFIYLHKYIWIVMNSFCFQTSAKKTYEPCKTATYCL